MSSQYSNVVKIYKGDSESALRGFVYFLCGAVSVFIVYKVCKETEWIDSLALSWDIGWGWIAFGMWWILTGAFMLVSDIPLSSYEAERRRKLVACPKCQHETKIVKDDLLSESVISERKKDKNNKKITEHYRVGTRLVTIACESCGYTESSELKFKERA